MAYEVHGAAAAGQQRAAAGSSGLNQQRLVPARAATTRSRAAAAPCSLRARYRGRGPSPSRSILPTNDCPPTTLQNHEPGPPRRAPLAYTGCRGSSASIYSPAGLQPQADALLNLKDSLDIPGMGMDASLLAWAWGVGRAVATSMSDSEDSGPNYRRMHVGGVTVTGSSYADKLPFRTHLKCSLPWRMLQCRGAYYLK